MKDAHDLAFFAAANLPFEKAQGAAALRALAARFPQLYVAPVAEEASAEEIAATDEAYRMAARRGLAPAASLGHFSASPSDELRIVQTLAGDVPVLYLAKRSDFEAFLQIIGHKAHAVPVLREVGAMTYCGLTDWKRVEAARCAYEAAGGQNWLLERAALAKAGAFRTELVVISEGPYSNLAAEETPYEQGEWLLVSHEIRLYHECAHVVCRRLMPHDIAPLWDEITADAVGLIKATGHYDAALAAAFLGVSCNGFSGGRLREYFDESQGLSIDECARRTFAAIEALGARLETANLSDPFALLLELKKEQGVFE